MLTNEILKKRYFITLFIISAVSFMLIFMVFFYSPGNYRASQQKLENTVKPMVTQNTTRIYGRTLYESLCAITQTAYPALEPSSKPNAIILVREDKKLDAILASGISHSPVNAPILYTSSEDIPEAIWKEMMRLDPQGIAFDRNIKVILIGDIPDKVKQKIADRGWKYRNIKGKDIYELGKNIDDYLSAIHGNHSDSVMLASVEEPESALIQASWNAHKGDAFFFIEKDTIPEKIKEALKSRYGGAYIYILGSSSAFSEKAYNELAVYGHVQKVPEDKDIYEQSVGFIRYRDMGKNFSWWLGKKSREFGWGITEAGHNFVFVNPLEWHSAVTSSILSQRGKNAAMILLQKDRVPEKIRSYLKSVQPSYTTSQAMIFNHGWIIGDTSLINESVQGEIDSLLENDRGESIVDISGR